MPDATNDRQRDLMRFYELMAVLSARCGGTRLLQDCSGRQAWPQRGVYFFHEEGEGRTESGCGLRIVRVGTHALTSTSRTTLWNRLSQHRGDIKTGGGNHRGSIFRLLAGQALIRKHNGHYPTWGQGQNAAREVRAQEKKLELDVSVVIRQMPFLWLAVDDDPGSASQRGAIERNAIALLSNYEKPALDPSSSSWLGLFSDREKVRKSGLWNQNHVEESYDPAFLDALAQLIDKQSGRPS